MDTSTDARLEQAIATLGELIAQVGACGQRQSMMFLEMARLQLQLDLNGITDDEFGAFCEALERGALASKTLARPGQPRARHDGTLRIQGRGWQCSNGIAERRVGRRVRNGG
jgi:hypothetical protein